MRNSSPLRRAPPASPDAAPQPPQPPRPPRPPRAPGESRSGRHEATDRQVHKLPIGRNGSLDLANISGDVIVTRGQRRRGGRRGDPARLRRHARGGEATARTDLRRRHQGRAASGGPREVPRPVQRRTAQLPFERRLSRHRAGGRTRDRALGLGRCSGREHEGGSVGRHRQRRRHARLGATRVMAAKSVSGDVSLTGISSEGTLAASSVSGDVIARGLKADRLELDERERHGPPARRRLRRRRDHLDQRRRRVHRRALEKRPLRDAVALRRRSG